jgi:hypothetical protein
VLKNPPIANQQNVGSNITRNHAKFEHMIKYDIFTYQISPISNAQFKLFGENYSYDDLVKNKNKFFAISFEDLSFFSKRHKLNYKIEYADDEFILIRLANKKTIKLEKKFHEEFHEIEPSCLIGFYNNSDVQLMAIESDKTSFGNSFSVLKIIENALTKQLDYYNLGFYPQPKYEARILWEMLERFDGRVEKLKFEFSKPNLARVNNALSDELKEAGKILNSAITKIEFDAPDKQVLENLNIDNKQLVDLVKTSSEGAGPAKIKLTGLRSWETTENSVKSIELDTLEIEADRETIRTFVQELKDFLKGA